MAPLQQKLVVVSNKREKPINDRRSSFKTGQAAARFKGVALVDGKVVCEATMMCARSREA